MHKAEVKPASQKPKMKRGGAHTVVQSSFASLVERTVCNGRLNIAVRKAGGDPNRIGGTRLSEGACRMEPGRKWDPFPIPPGRRQGEGRQTQPASAQAKPRQHGS
jgi:hypothetical protein